MAVRVFIRRKIDPEHEPHVNKVLLRLRARAMEQRGYISGETLRNLENPSEILVISTWNELGDWKDWESSPERKRIQEEIAGHLQGDEALSIYSYS